MLIANMVAKDEEGRYLSDVLDHLAKIVDLIVFTDDASSDNTANIAEGFGAKVLRLRKPLFVEDESKLRSIAWGHLSNFAKPGDWILCIDADEKLYGTNMLPYLMDQNSYHVLGVTFYHMWNPTQYRDDKLWVPRPSSRMFRFFSGGEFLSRRLACGSEPTYVQELIRQNRVMWETNLKMAHLGYIRDEDKVAKYKRYSELDGGQFHNNSHIESIIDTNPHLVDWDG